VIGNGHRSDEDLSIIYDGECPFCSQFVTFYRIRSNVKQLKLIDARNHPTLIEAYRSRGYEINDGMLVLWNDEVYHGAEAMRLLARLSSNDGAFNKINRWTFGSAKVGTHTYPIFVALRKLALRLLGRSELKG
jgi:predicted DCC family thiol-disulfide oxidoreductase YuxK